MAGIGTSPQKRCAALCPQPKEADIRPLDGNSRFDPEPSLRLRRSTAMPAPLNVKTACSRRGIVPFYRQPSHGERYMPLAIGRRELIAAAGSAAAWPLAARAQQPGKSPRIGVLVSASPPHPFADAFWRGLHALGYSEGRNIKVEFRYTDGRIDRAEEFAAAFVRSGVDVIVAHFNLATRAAVGATRTIPIVMAAAGDNL